MLIRTAVHSDSVPVYALLKDRPGVAEWQEWIAAWPDLMRQTHVIVLCYAADSEPVAVATLIRVPTLSHWECRAEVVASKGCWRTEIERKIRTEARMLGATVLILDGKPATLHGGSNAITHRQGRWAR